MKGQIGQTELGMTLVLMDVQLDRSAEASIIFVQLEMPWTKSNAPSLENSVILIVGWGTETATTLV